MAQTINVDISTRGAPPVAYAHQGDTDRTFLVNVFENGAAFGVAGFTVKVAAILPSDNGYTVITGADMVSATKTNTGTNQLMFTPSAQYTARSGRGILTLIMTTNTGTPATIRPINIDFRIQKSADGPDVIAGASDFPEGLEEIAESVFQEYLSTYLPPVAPSSSAAANKAADAKLTGEALDDLKSDFINFTSKKLLPINSTWTKAAINIDGTLNTNASWRLTTTDIFYCETDALVSLADGFTGQMARYSSDGIFIERRSISNGYRFDAGTYLRVSVYKTAESISDDSTLFYQKINLQYFPYKILDPTDYNSKMSNVKDNIVSVVLNNDWDDAPWTHLNISVTGIFINTRYSFNYCIQEYIVISSGVKWSRITNASDGSVYRDWTTDNTLQPLKILALGDSICAGYRNSGKGFVGDLGLPYKNIGVSGASISNIVTSVTNIPDQLIAESSYTPDVIIADGGINDYTHGATLGTVPNAPAKNDNEADELDRNTVAGACGFLFYTMIKKYPKAQRFFVIVHKMYYPDGDMYYPTYSNGTYTQQDLHDLIVKMCNLYNVKVIDIYNEGIINTLYPEYVSTIDYDTDNSVTYTQYVNSDGIHPLDLGYREGYIPLIRKALGIGTVK